MGRRTALLSSGLILAAIGCQESVTAPGACPDYCKDTAFDVIDSVIQGAIVADSSFRGYVETYRAGEIQITAQTNGLESRGILRFVTFPPKVPVTPGDTSFGAISAIDSFVVELSVARRRTDVTGVSIALHSLDPSIDSTATYAAVDPSFDGSALLGQVPVPDTLTQGTIRYLLPGTAFGAVPTDSLPIALGLELTGADSTFVSLASLGGTSMATIRRYFSVDSVGTSVNRQDARTANLTMSLPSLIVPATPGTVAVGGLPAARVILRVTGIEDILATASVIRATLELTPGIPVIGAPGDSILVRANPATVDFGKKSPFVTTTIDELGRTTALVPVGSSGAFEIDVTTILRAWALNDQLPRSLVLTALPEASSVGEVRVFSSRGAQPPRLRLTFVPPLGLSN